MDKAAERSNLILQLGRLLAPIYDLATGATPPSQVEYRVAAARYTLDFSRWRNEAERFVIVGGVTFGHELNDILRSLSHLLEVLNSLGKDADAEPEKKQAVLVIRLRERQEQTIEAIGRVPIDWAPRLLEEKTPFSTYLHIRDAIGTAKKRIHYLDRYLASEFYPLFMRDIDRSIEIRLVTTKGNQNYGVANITTVSKLAAQEFTNYQLIECSPSDLHDRNLRVDDTNFFLGTSAKDAGKHPTNFSPADSSANGHSILDSIIAKGVVVT